jgi:hypothetical protein
MKRGSGAVAAVRKPAARANPRGQKRSAGFARTGAPLVPLRLHSHPAACSRAAFRGCSPTRDPDRNTWVGPACCKSGK